MTTNQVNYLKHLEDVRSNKAKEALSAEVNAETRRANVAKEAENYRHNVVSEAETRMHNKGDLRIKQLNADESIRSHLAQEQLLSRQLDETQRSNVMREQETYRSNRVRETETERTNRANELIKSAQLSETIRANVANENLTVRRLSETERSNRVAESLGWANQSVAQQNAYTRADELAHAVSYDTRRNLLYQQELDIRDRQTDINKQDADTREAAEKRKNQEFAHQKDYDTANTIIKGFDVGSKAAKTVFEIVKQFK